MKKTYNDLSVGNWILFGFTAQHAAIAYLLGLLSFLTFFAKWPRFEGNAIMSLQLRDWFSKSWRKEADGSEDKGISRYSTTLFRATWWHEDRPVPKTPEEELDSRHEKHERKHIHQFEDACMQGFVLGLIVAILLWAFGWYSEAWQPALAWELIWLIMPVMLTTNWITGLLRYGRAAKYRPAWQHASKGAERSWFSRIYDSAYLDSEHERSARAQTEGFVGNKTWAEHEYEDRHMPRNPDGSPVT